MGIFTSKIAIGVLAGGFSLGAAGLLFTGSDTLKNASDYVRDVGSKIANYENNENSLLDKISTLKTDANSKIGEANKVISDKKAAINQLNTQIAGLEEAKKTLETQVANLKVEIDQLRADLSDSNANLEATKIALAEKTKQYDAKVAELKKANETITYLNHALNLAYEKAKEADRHVTELEGEIQKANKEVEDHGKVVDEVKAQTDGDQPLTGDEVENIDTELDAVDTQ